MKNNFYRKYYFNLVNAIVIIFISLFILIPAFSITFSRKKEGDYMFLIFALIVSISLIILYFMSLIIYRKSLLSKVNINENGLICKYKELELLNINWNDIDDVKLSMPDRSPSLSFMYKMDSTFKRNNFYFNVDKKILKTLLFYCKNDIIRTKLESIKLRY